MARLAALIDRPPNDTEWKGAFAWATVLSLAQSHHEVLAMTTLDPASIEVFHPRLTVTRPATGWGLKYFPKWMQSLLQFQPEVIHTFSLKPLSTLRALTVWPLLDLTLAAAPGLRRFSTTWSTTDFAPFSSVSAPVEIALDSQLKKVPERPFVLIPASVSSWRQPEMELLLLSEFLQSHREYDAHIIGGWGGLTLSERRQGWRLLKDVVEQVHMGDPCTWLEFTNLANQCDGVWLRSLPPQSWPAQVAGHVARQRDLATWGDVPELNVGSTANFLSRLYSQN